MSSGTPDHRDSKRNLLIAYIIIGVFCVSAFILLTWLIVHFSCRKTEASANAPGHGGNTDNSSAQAHADDLEAPATPRADGQQRSPAAAALEAIQRSFNAGPKGAPKRKRRNAVDTHGIAGPA
ncbi:hypothetical protein FZEAL_961 [Fusarium zealandicum]|uniref:Transmembrane protein n=1 Tax=Fusarium zealandicum TaxID=1053134 RepID=A0A8H4UUD3_9HYPO|nr:hypothetical protein FZEAL_961 [Fusarium zealandicum]